MTSKSGRRSLLPLSPHPPREGFSMTCRCTAPLAFLSLTVLLSVARPAPPVSTDERLTVELIAAAPEIVTPTGVAVDARGDVWVVENHTHQRPKEYTGPETDRIRVFSD